MSARKLVAGDACPICREVMSEGSTTDLRRRSRDHILKRANGHTALIHGDTWNIRIVCQRCNGLLEVLNQCPAAVACYLVVPHARIRRRIVRGQRPRVWRDAAPAPTLAAIIESALASSGSR